MEEVSLLKYEQVLDEIQDKENHLLIGNGFNRGLGVDTSYKNIFDKMINDEDSIYKDSIYKDIEKEIESTGYNIELLIGKLQDAIDINNPNSVFLKKYIHNKVKLDFMRAAHSIIKSKIKNVYAEKNEGVYLLLKNFSNYFTINYDLLLYLLLLNYKSADKLEDNIIAFGSSLKLFIDTENILFENIYDEIQEARKNGTIKFQFGDKDNISERPLNKIKKDLFINSIEEYARINNKKWKKKYIQKVVDRILKEEKKYSILKKVDDGSKQYNLLGDNKEFIFDTNSITQNLFFLHGAFHIYKDGQSIKKITQSSNKALYQRLEEILNSEKKEIVCIFQSEDKETAINENPYLCKCLSKLGELSGNMVIIGSSLADNDDHIFNQINNSNINTLYISTLDKYKEDTYKIASTKFSTKTIHLFDAKSISYKLPENTDKEPKQKRRGK